MRVKYLPLKIVILNGFMAILARFIYILGSMKDLSGELNKLLKSLISRNLGKYFIQHLAQDELSNRPIRHLIEFDTPTGCFV